MTIIESSHMEMFLSFRKTCPILDDNPSKWCRLSRMYCENDMGYKRCVLFNVIIFLLPKGSKE